MATQIYLDPPDDGGPPTENQRRAQALLRLCPELMWRIRRSAGSGSAPIVIGADAERPHFCDDDGAVHVGARYILAPVDWA